MAAAKKGLSANIHTKLERIAHGSGEKMKKPGASGAPQAGAFEKSEKTASTSKKMAAKKATAKKATGRKTAKSASKR